MKNLAMDHKGVADIKTNWLLTVGLKINFEVGTC
jgi:hypothetical protein